MVVGNSGHVVSSLNRAGSWFRRRMSATGTGRFSGAGPRRMRPGGVVVRAVAGAEPAAEVAGAVAERHAAEVGADAHHHQPFAVFVERAVLVGRRRRRRRCWRCGHWRRAGRHRRPRGRASISSSVRRRMKTGLPSHLTVSWRAFGDAGDIDPDRAQRLHVGGGVHLVDERPDGGTRPRRPGAAGGIVQEVPAGAFVIVCV